MKISPVPLDAVTKGQYTDMKVSSYVVPHDSMVKSGMIDE